MRTFILAQPGAFSEVLKSSLLAGYKPNRNPPESVWIETTLPEDASITVQGAIDSAGPFFDLVTLDADKLHQLFSPPPYLRIVRDGEAPSGNAVFGTSDGVKPTALDPNDAVVRLDVA